MGPRDIGDPSQPQAPYLECGRCHTPDRLSGRLNELIHTKRLEQGLALIKCYAFAVLLS